MNRKEFLKEAGSGVFGFFKEIGKPFVEDKLEQVDMAIDTFAGIEWQTVPNLEKQCEMKKIGKRTVFFLSKNDNVKAFDHCCQTCGGLIQYQTFSKVFHCFSCGTSYSLEKEEGTLSLFFYQTKYSQEQWLIGFSKEGKSYA